MSVFLHFDAAAAETAPCQLKLVDQDFAGEQSLKNFTFHLSGPLPVVYLSSLYNRIAECAPSALGQRKENVSRSGIFVRAREIGILPKNDTKAFPSEFVEASDKLTLHITGIEPKANGPYYLPDITPGIVPDVLFQPVTQPSKNNTNKDIVLNRIKNICSNIGKDDKCSSADKTVILGRTGNKRRYIPIEHYRIDVTVRLPADKGKIVANDVLAYILKRNPGLAKSPINLPTFDDLGKPLSNTDIENCQAPADADKIYQIIDNTNKYSDGNSTVLVAEHTTSKPNSVISIFDLGIPYFLAGNNTPSPQILSSPIPDVDSDVGHGYHVAYIIGSRGVAAGWTGLAPSSNVMITSFSNLTSTIMPARRAELLQNPGKAPGTQFSVINLSLMLNKGVCRPSDIELNNKFIYDGMLQSILDENQFSDTPGAASLYVIASSSKFNDCWYDDVENPADYDGRNCSDLACLGKYDNAITVAPLTGDGDAIRPEVRFDSSNLMIAAPGSNILSADDDPATGQVGFRVRCGASQAAPMVAALAARLIASFNLSAAAAKERIFSTATLMAATARLTGRQMRVAGIVDVDRALESPPDKDVIWIRDSHTSPPTVRKLVGQIVFYGGKFSAVPAIASNQGRRSKVALDGGPVATNELIAVKRVWTTGGVGAITFRNLFRDSSNNDYTTPRLGSPYEFDKDQLSNSICNLSPLQNPGLVDCVRLNTLSGPIAIDVGTIDMIVMHQ
jgi:hypothetical protein